MLGDAGKRIETCVEILKMNKEEDSGKEACNKAQDAFLVEAKEHHQNTKSTVLQQDVLPGHMLRGAYFQLRCGERLEMWHQCFASPKLHKACILKKWKRWGRSSVRATVVSLVSFPSNKSGIRGT